LPTAKHGHPKAPAALAKYYFAASLVPNTTRMTEPGATRPHSGLPSPCSPTRTSVRRQDIAKLESLIAQAEPPAKGQADALIAAHHYPPD